MKGNSSTELRGAPYYLDPILLKAYQHNTNPEPYDPFKTDKYAYGMMLFQLISDKKYRKVDDIELLLCHAQIRVILKGCLVDRSFSSYEEIINLVNSIYTEADCGPIQLPTAISQKEVDLQKRINPPSPPKPSQRISGLDANNEKNYDKDPS